MSAAVVAVHAGVASAALMPIPVGNVSYTSRNNPRAGEPNHEQILEHLYGGNFVSTGVHGLDYTNGSVLVQRVADDRNSVETRIGQVVGDLTQYTDKFWQDQFSKVEAEARYGTYTQQFGFYPQERGGTYQELFKIAAWQYGYGVHGEANVPDMRGATFRWARNGENGLWNSDPAQNRDGLDHLITYKVTAAVQEQPRAVALEEFRTFLLFWEDQSDRGNVNWYDVGDWDFNDMVVEVRAQYNLIPEPTAVAGVVGALGLLMRRRTR